MELVTSGHIRDKGDAGILQGTGWNPGSFREEQDWVTQSSLPALEAVGLSPPPTLPVILKRHYLPKYNFLQKSSELWCPLTWHPLRRGLLQGHPSEHHGAGLCGGGADSLPLTEA